MAKRPAFPGICTTCVHAGDCALSVAGRGPVFHCEEFECSGLEPSEVEDRTDELSSGEDRTGELSSSRPSPEDEDESTAPEYRGLCSDCAHRLFCMYADTEGGIWHCEEYDWMPPSEGGASAAPDGAEDESEDESGPAGIGTIVQKHAGSRGALIAILEDIQSQQGYLSESALEEVSRGLGCSLVDVYGVATFYRSFSLTPRGRHTICVCEGTACHVRGAPLVVEEFERQLGIKRGETTLDGEFTLETVNCLGACALGPIVKVDDEYFSKVGTAKVRLILRKFRRQPKPAAESRPAVAAAEGPGA